MEVLGLFKNVQRTQNVPTGAAVFLEGQAGEEMYGIIEGEIELRTAHRVIRTIGPGEVFGEMAIIDSSPRSASAVATADTVLTVIDRNRFLFLVHETPMFALSVMSTMANRFRSPG